MESKATQLELWNDSPESWRKRMEDDAFAIAFPDDTRIEGDRVDVFMDYSQEEEGYHYSEWTWGSGWPSQFVIEVRWFVPNYSNYNSTNSRPGTRLHHKATFEKKDALRFWKQLMQRGSR